MSKGFRMKVSQEDIKKVVNEVLELPQQSIDNIKDTEDLRNYNLDSLKGVQLLAQLENEFQIEFAFDDLNIENVTTLNKIYYLLKKYIGEDFE